MTVSAESRSGHAPSEEPLIDSAYVEESEIERSRVARRRPIGVLALQGSYNLHEGALQRLGARTRRVRRPEDLRDLDGLVLPGGESTTMAHLAREYELFGPLQEAARGGMPMFGTCAGAILLGRGDDDPPRLGVAPVTMRRNAYGRQVDSFTAPVWLCIDGETESFHGVFIRAPVIVVPEAASGEGHEPVEVLGRHEDSPVLVRCGALLLGTFHPELTDDLRLHRYFLTLCASAHARTLDVRAATTDDARESALRPAAPGVRSRQSRAAGTSAAHRTT